jgi:hypothetical protein
VTAPAGGGTLTFKTRYDIELNFDVATSPWTATRWWDRYNGKATTLPNNQNGLHVGWDGTSANYVDASFPIPGGTHEVSIVYFTDAAVAGNSAQRDRRRSLSTRSPSTGSRSARMAGLSMASR